MILEHKIKEGLLFQHKTFADKLSNSSFLQRHHDSISLTCVFSGLDCNLNFASVNHSNEITFIFQNTFLQNFAEDEKEFSLQQFPEHQPRDICCNTQMILFDIINCKLTGVFRNMFLVSKALALLLCFQKCNTLTESPCESCKFLTKPIEKEKIFRAKEIILSNLNNPPTTQELSIKIGINQCYLKKGFKELFSSTVYGFVQEQRMLKAKFLLSTTDFTVSQVAEQIGFSSQSNFSAAFKKFTGVYPSKLQQN